MRTELKIVFRLFFIGIFIIPLFSILTSHLTFLLFKPKSQHLKLTPTLDKNNLIRFSCDLLIQERSAIYLVIIVPETSHNFNLHSFFVNTGLENNKQLFYTMRHKSNTFKVLDSLMFFPFIKLNLYDLKQTLRMEVGTVDSFDARIMFSVKNEMHFSEFYLDVLEEANWFKMFIYHHALLFRFMTSLVLFSVIFTVGLYLLILIYRNVGKITQEEIQEIIEEEFVKQS